MLPAPIFRSCRRAGALGLTPMILALGIIGPRHGRTKQEKAPHRQGRGPRCFSQILYMIVLPVLCLRHGGWLYSPLLFISASQGTIGSEFHRFY